MVIIALQPLGVNKNSSKPLNIRDDSEMNPKQVIDAKQIVEISSILRCLMITHNLAKWIEANRRNAEERVEAIAAPYNPYFGELANELMSKNPSTVAKATTVAIKIVNIHGFFPAWRAV